MIRRLPRSTRTDTLFPYTCSSDLVTTSPDVTVSTNLGALVNQRGLFRRGELKDVFASAQIPSAQKWSGNRVGQHIELGIAEHNLFLMLAALGLAAPLFGTRLLPTGTVYDTFIAPGREVRASLVEGKRWSIRVTLVC